MVLHLEAPTSLDSLLLTVFVNKIPTSGLMVAYSGGIDSTVLLHLLGKSKGKLNLPVRAVHVDHGLHVDSGFWSKHCMTQCKSLGLVFESFKVDVPKEKGESLEAAARDARYHCLAEQLQDGELLLTAHHLDDQEETFLLQALRGAGLPGLSAMPVFAEFAAGFHARPFLAIPRSELMAYAIGNNLAWIDDSSNENSRFDRNYLRSNVLPAIHERWPGARQTLARSARLCGDGQKVIAATCRDILGEKGVGSLDLERLLAAERPIAQALLRTWLQDNGLPLPSETKIRQMINEVIPASDDAEPKVSWPGGEVRRYREQLYCMSEIPGSRATECEYSPLADTDIPLGGHIQWKVTDGSGVALEMLQQPGWQLRFRQGGERIRPEGHAMHRELKKLFQEQGVFPWVRNLLPLIFHHDKLIAVADLWLEDGSVKGQSRPRLRPVWHQRPQIIAE